MAATLRDLNTKFTKEQAAQFEAAAQQNQGVSGDLAQGWEAGKSSALGQLNTLAGHGMNALGFDGSARLQAAQENQQLAQEEAQGLTEFKDVDGLRSGLRWAAGALGQSAPVVLPAIGAGLLTGGSLPAALAAGSAAALPFELGGQLQRQEADPTTAGMSSGERLALAAPGAIGAAVAQNVVPAGVAGRILGKGAAGGLKTIIGRAAADVPANAAGEGAAEIARQFSDNLANPNAGYNLEAAKQAAIEGGAMGGVFGAAGAVPHLAHNIVKAPPQLAKDAFSFVGSKAKDGLEAVKGFDYAGAAKGAKDLAKEGYDLSADAAKSGFGAVKGAVEGIDLGGAAKNAMPFMRQQAENAVDATGIDIAGAAENAGPMAKAAARTTADFVGEQARKAKAAVEGFDTKPVKDKVTEATARVATTLKGFKDAHARGMERVASGEQYFDPKSFAGKTEGALKAALEKDAKDRDAAVEAAAVELQNDPDLSEGQRSQLGEFMRNMKDGASQRGIAAMATFRREAKSALDTLSQFGKEFAKKPEGNAKKSADYSGINKAIVDSISPYVRENLPHLADRRGTDALGEALRDMVGEALAGRPISPAAQAKLVSVAGPHTAALMDRAREATKTSDPKQLDNFYSAAHDLLLVQNQHRALVDLIGKEYTGEPLTDAGNRRIAAEMIAWATERPADGSRRKFTDAEMVQRLGEHFKNPGKVLDAIDGMITRQENMLAGNPDEALASALTAERAQRDGGDKASFEQGAREGEVRSDTGDMVGIESRPRLRTFREDGQDGMTLSEEFRPGKNGHPSAQAQALAKARAVDPNARWATADELGSDHPFVKKVERNLYEQAGLEMGLSGADADAWVQKELKKYGTAVSELPAGNLALEPREVNSMRLDAKQWGRSPSRIEDGQGNVFDAVKIIKIMRERAKEAGEGTNQAQLLLDGVAALQDHLGTTFDIKDSTVVDGTGKVTWGQLKRAARRRQDAEAPGTKAQVVNEQGIPDMLPHELRQEVRKLEDYMDAKVEEAAGPKIQELRDMGVRPSRADLKIIYREARNSLKEKFAPINERIKALRAEEFKSKSLDADSDPAVTGQRDPDPFGPTFEATKGRGSALPVDPGDQKTDILRGLKTTLDKDGPEPDGITPERGRAPSLLGPESALGRKDLPKPLPRGQELRALVAEAREVAKAFSKPDAETDTLTLGGEFLGQGYSVRQVRPGELEVLSPSGKVLASVEGSPDPKAVAAKKAAFLEKAASGDAALLEELKASNDVKGLQRAGEALYNRLAERAELVDLSTAVKDVGHAAEAALERGDLAEFDKRMDELFSMELEDPEKYRGALATARAFAGLAEQFRAGKIEPAATEALRQHMVSAAGESTLGKIIDASIDKVESETMRVVLKATRKIAGDVRVRDEALPDKAYGYFDPASQSIALSKDARSFHTLAHEGVHAATMRALNDDPALQAAFVHLLDHAAKHDKVIGMSYGGTNSLEFIAEGLTNPEFRARLKAVPASDRITKFLGDRMANAWDSFVALMRKALGIPKEAESALSQLVSLSGHAMKASVDRTPFTLGEMVGRGVHGGEAVAKRFDQLVRERRFPTELRQDLIKGAAKVRAGEKVPPGIMTGLAALERMSKDKSVDSYDMDRIRQTTDDLDNFTHPIANKLQSVRDSGTANALRTVNDRLRSLAEDPDNAYAMLTKKYSMEGVDPNATGPRNFKEAADYIRKVLGPKIKVTVANLLHAGEFIAAAGNKFEDHIRLSMHSLNPMSGAFHESMHGFIKNLSRTKDGEIINVLRQAAESPTVLLALRKKLEGQPDAIKQLADPEERIAYMYQFHRLAEMKLTEPLGLGKPAKGVFNRIAEYIRSILGIWSNDRRALYIMEYFHSGEYAENMGKPDAVRKALLEPGTNARIEWMKKATAPMRNLGEAVAVAGHQRLRDTGIPALNELADMIKRQGTSVGGDQGYLPTSRRERVMRLNAFAEKLGDVTDASVAAALDVLQARDPNAANALKTPEERLAVRAVVSNVRSLLAETKAYMEAAGVEVGDLGPDYFPRVYDLSYISANKEAFMKVLEDHGIKNPETVMQRLMTTEGAEFDVETSRPGMQHLKRRELAKVPDAALAPFMQKDLMRIVDSYVTQATRRAEWARRFDAPDAKGVMVPNKVFNDLLARAAQEGADPKDLDTATKYMMAVDGTLGDTISPEARRLQGNIMVYQNLRLLPLMVFSSVVDPAGIMVRGGSVGDAWHAFKRGIREIPKGFKDNPEHDAATKLAADIGVIESAVLTHALGTSFNQGMVGDTGRAINDKLFKYNLVEQFNTSMRVAATEAAVQFIAKHADGKASPHSARWMAELGLEPGDVKMSPEGKLIVRGNDKVIAAINQWVDGAVLRPDAADKPLWMSDPHYALVAHLKQFAFSFQETILKRVAHEMRNGNMAPAYALASYIPIMIAADATKAMLTGNELGNDEWGLEDYVGHGIERAGLLGVGQFPLDASQFGLTSVFGPTVEQLTQAVDVVAGDKEFAPFALKSMPANALYRGAFETGDVSEAKFRE